MARQFNKSADQLKRAERVIPLGSQTFSKSRMQFPQGAAPLFLVKGDGARVWDPDGNDYIDFINGLAALTLGYKDRDVDAAVKAQLEDGVIFSLPHPLETEVAELIVDMVPCAEQVRFGKNGSDATSGAIRLARAYTGRDHVAVCGYHGWQDWYIGSTARNLGVPEATQGLTHIFQFNDLDSLTRILSQNDFAAVILEPMNIAYPDAGFLEGVVEVAHAHGALAIFDEMVTGFRVAPGGAQELFGVTPDLATFGKGLANGFPLSAVAGRADIMALMEEIFFSFTMGGECLSLAAAKATLSKIKRDAVPDHLARIGSHILDNTRECIKAAQCGHFLEISGHPAWSFLHFANLDIKTLFMQELLARGFLTFGTHNISFAHDVGDAKALLSAYEEVFPMLSTAVANDNVRDLLRCEPLVPLFQVR